MNRLRNALPATWGELLAMCACYVLTALLAVMVLAPHKVFAFAMAVLP